MANWNFASSSAEGRGGQRRLAPRLAMASNPQHPGLPATPRVSSLQQISVLVDVKIRPPHNTRVTEHPSMVVCSWSAPARDCVKIGIIVTYQFCVSCQPDIDIHRLICSNFIPHEGFWWLTGK